MDTVVATYVAYLAVCVPVALFVGWTLHRNGRVFLVEIFEGKEDLADSINHLLMVGFYLASLGFVCLMLDQFTTDPANTAEAIRTAGRQIGIILLVFGAAHLANMILLGWARKAVLLDPLSERIEARRFTPPTQRPAPQRDPFSGPIPPEAMS